MRLIDAEALKTKIQKIEAEALKHGFAPEYVCVDLFLDFLDNAPAIEAKPIIHAHWIYDGEDDWSGNSSWYCSKCSSFIETEEDTLSYGYNFCPNCGAQMDELVSNTDELNHIAEGGKKETME